MIDRLIDLTRVPPPLPSCRSPNEQLKDHSSANSLDPLDPLNTLVYITPFPFDHADIVCLFFFYIHSPVDIPVF